MEISSVLSSTSRILNLLNEVTYKGLVKLELTSEQLYIELDSLLTQNEIEMIKEKIHQYDFCFEENCGNSVLIIN